MTITQLDPADSVAMGQWYNLMVAVTRHDVPDFPTPSRQEHSARFEHPWLTSTEESLLAWDGDQVVGAASYLLPQTENLSMVYLELIVHPQHRRRGIAGRPACAFPADQATRPSGRASDGTDQLLRYVRPRAALPTRPGSLETRP